MAADLDPEALELARDWNVRNCEKADAVSDDDLARAIMAYAEKREEAWLVAHDVITVKMVDKAVAAEREAIALRVNRLAHAAADAGDAHAPVLFELEIWIHQRGEEPKSPENEPRTRFLTKDEMLEMDCPWPPETGCDSGEGGSDG